MGKHIIVVGADFTDIAVNSNLKKQNIQKPNESIANERFTSQVNNTIPVSVLNFINNSTNTLTTSNSDKQ